MFSLSIKAISSPNAGADESAKACEGREYLNDTVLSNASFIIRAVSFAEKIKINMYCFTLFLLQVRHRASKKVYAMKLLSKFEMVSTVHVQAPKPAEILHRGSCLSG